MRTRSAIHNQVTGGEQASERLRERVREREWGGVGVESRNPSIHRMPTDNGCKLVDTAANSQESGQREGGRILGLSLRVS